MGNIKWLGKYEVISVCKTQDGENWRVHVGIRRAWPRCLLDHRPWEEFARRKFPVRTFIGKGLAWYEINAFAETFAPGRHVSILNAIVSDHTIDQEIKTVQVA